jgi:methionine aminopeptidase
VLDAAAAAVRPGVTTDELDRVVHDATIEVRCVAGRVLLSVLIMLCV